MAKTKKKEKSPSLQLSPEKKEIKRVVYQAVAEIFSGPLPHPSLLSQYNQVVPGSAERIIAMAESQSKHRQQLENKVLDSDIRNGRLGLHYGLIISLVAVIGGTICITSGYEVGGSIIGGTGLTGLVGVFVYGSRQRRKEREKRFKAEMLPPKQS